MQKTLWNKVKENAQSIISDWLRNEIALTDVLELISEMEEEGEEEPPLRGATFEKAVFRKLQTAFPEAAWQYAHPNAPGIKVGIDIEQQIALLFFNAEQVSNAGMINLLGRLLYLSHYAYKDGIIVLTYGEKGLRHHPSIKEIRELTESLRCGFYYFERR